MNVLVVINEQHSVMTEQSAILNSTFSEVEFLKVPANGWTLKQMQKEASVLKEALDATTVVVFCSPIPAMMKLLDGWFVFHNDAREKLELPNGKIIMKVAEKGWQLV